MTDLLAESAPHLPTAPRASANEARLAGAVAAAVALGVGELVTGLGGSSQSLIGSVGNGFIQQSGGDLARTAIRLFQTADKPALITGIVVISLAIGAALGVAARRRRWVGVLGFVAFGVVGVAAAARDPLASTGRAAVGATVAVAAGLGTLTLLLRLAASSHAVTPSSPPARRDTPTSPHASRRAFFGWSAAAGAFAATAAVAGRTAMRGTANAARAAIRLPAPTNRAVPPGSPAALQGPGVAPFEVDGLTPYLVANHAFYRIDTALVVPNVDPDTWSLKVSGLVDRPFELTFAELLAMDQVEEAVTLSCVSNEVGGNLVGNALWQGVPLRTLLQRAGVQPGASQVVGRSVDGFTAGFPTAALDGDRTAMVALGMNGEPLPVVHGFPARLVVAGLYGYVSATKWLGEIRLTTLDDFDGYWIPRGWSKDGPIKTESRIDVPANGALLQAGTLPIAGVAWAPGPGRGVVKVEVQVDDEPWREATLGPVLSGNTWRQWMVAWNATPGTHTLQVRATDGTGETQTEEQAPPEPDGASGWDSHRVKVS
ncbi:MAG TPA: molybdopterin-dependent oxidoreductase [Acidimicrobiales bacterium]